MICLSLSVSNVGIKNMMTKRSFSQIKHKNKAVAINHKFCAVIIIKIRLKISILIQVLQRRLVLRQRLLLPYVPLPDVGSANVPV